MTRTRASSGDIGSPVESDTLSSEQPVMAARMTAESAVRRSMFFISRVFRRWFDSVLRRARRAAAAVMPKDTKNSHPTRLRNPPAEGKIIIRPAYFESCADCCIFVVDQISDAMKREMKYDYERRTRCPSRTGSLWRRPSAPHVIPMHPIRTSAWGLRRGLRAAAW